MLGVNNRSGRSTMDTNTQALEDARAIYRRDDWDGDGTTSIHLPTNIAVALLDAKGWQVTRHPGIGGRPTHSCYTAPDGKVCWELDEALQIALTAETLDR